MCAGKWVNSRSVAVAYFLNLFSWFVLVAGFYGSAAIASQNTHWDHSVPHPNREMYKAIAVQWVPNFLIGVLFTLLIVAMVRFFAYALGYLRVIADSVANDEVDPGNWTPT